MPNALCIRSILFAVPSVRREHVLSRCMNRQRYANHRSTQQFLHVIVMKPFVGRGHVLSRCRNHRPSTDHHPTHQSPCHCKERSDVVISRTHPKKRPTPVGRGHVPAGAGTTNCIQICLLVPSAASRSADTYPQPTLTGLSMIVPSKATTLKLSVSGWSLFLRFIRLSGPSNDTKSSQPALWWRCPAAGACPPSR